MLVCSGIAVADQKVVSSENDFTAGSFSGLQLNLEPTSTSCNYKYTSIGYDYYTSGQHGCDTCNACNSIGACDAVPIDTPCGSCQYCDNNGQCRIMKWSYAGFATGKCRVIAYGSVACLPSTVGTKSYPNLVTNGACDGVYASTIDTSQPTFVCRAQLCGYAS